MTSFTNKAVVRETNSTSALCRSSKLCLIERLFFFNVCSVLKADSDNNTSTKFSISLEVIEGTIEVK